MMGKPAKYSQELKTESEVENDVEVTIYTSGIFGYRMFYRIWTYSTLHTYIYYYIYTYMFFWFIYLLIIFCIYIYTHYIYTLYLSISIYLIHIVFEVHLESRRSVRQDIPYGARSCQFLPGRICLHSLQGSVVGSYVKHVCLIFALAVFIVDFEICDIVPRFIPCTCSFVLTILTGWMKNGRGQLQQKQESRSFLGSQKFTDVSVPKWWQCKGCSFVHGRSPTSFKAKYCSVNKV